MVQHEVFFLGGVGSGLMPTVFVVCRDRDREWNPANSDQGPPGTEPGGDIEVETLCVYPVNLIIAQYLHPLHGFNNSLLLHVAPVQLG